MNGNDNLTDSQRRHITLQVRNAFRVMVGVPLKTELRWLFEDLIYFTKQKFKRNERR